MSSATQASQVGKSCRYPFWIGFGITGAVIFNMQLGFTGACLCASELCGHVLTALVWESSGWQRCTQTGSHACIMALASASAVCRNTRCGRVRARCRWWPVGGRSVTCSFAHADKDREQSSAFPLNTVHLVAS